MHKAAINQRDSYIPNLCLFHSLIVINQSIH